MKKERFWFGVTLVVVPVCLFLLFLSVSMSPRMEGRPEGPIEGDVSVNGRPLSGGFVLFVPDDSIINAGIAPIDATGHFTILGRLYRRTGQGTPYRICLIPPRRRVTADSPLLSWAEAAEAWAHVEKETKDAERVRRLTDPKTSDLVVHLDTRAAQVDIDL